MIPEGLRDPSTGELRIEWEEIFQKYDPDSYGNHQQWIQRVSAPKSLAPKTFELILIAVDAIYAWPEPFIDLHFHAAFDHGATVQEIVETILVASLFRGGHALNHGLVAMDRVIRERTASGVTTPGYDGEK